MKFHWSIVDPRVDACTVHYANSIVPGFFYFLRGINSSREILHELPLQSQLQHLMLRHSITWGILGFERASAKTPGLPSLCSILPLPHNANS